MQMTSRSIGIAVGVCAVFGVCLGLISQQKLKYSALQVGQTGPVSNNTVSSEGQQAPQGDSLSPEAESLGDASVMEAEHVHQEPTYQHISPVLLREANQAIEEARYEYAESLLSELSKTQGVTVRGRTLLKLGACQETLGLDQAAAKSYQFALRRADSQEVMLAAKLGRARLWAKTGKAKSARNDLLRSLLIHQEIRSSSLEGRLMHQLGLVSANVALQGVVLQNGALQGAGNSDVASTNDLSNSVLSDDVLKIPEAEIAVEEFVRELVTTSPKREEKAQTGNVVQNILKLDESADSILLDVRTPGLSARELMLQIATAAGKTCVVDEDCRERLMSRTVSANFQGLPVSVVCDSVLFPLECTWSERNGELRILLLETESEKKQIQQRQLQQAERLLRHAMTSSPEHSLAPVSMVALAALSARQNDRLAASRTLQRTLKQFPETPHAAEIWLNLGKCQLQIDGDQALTSFYKSADLGDGGETEEIAKLFLGRIHLRNACPMKAISPLRKAIDQASDERLQMEAGLLLATACQMMGQQTESKEALAICLQNPHSLNKRNEIAVISSLIQSSQEKAIPGKRREDITLISAMNNLDFNSTFGEQWWSLSCREYHRLGFGEEALRLYHKYQTRYAGLPIEHELQSLLLSGSEEAGQPRASNCPDQNEMLTTATDFVLNFPPESSIEELLELYKAVSQRADTPRHVKRNLLQKLGYAYQKQGHHDLAIQCYTGAFKPQ